jgi:uroporphyrinogen decarboxylase
MGKSECDWIIGSMTEGVKERIPIGELCIDKTLIQQTSGSERAGFEETFSFVAGMNMDIFTLSPVYPKEASRLPRPGDCLWPDLKKWTTGTPLFTFALLDGAFEWGLRIFGFHDFLIMDRTSPLTFSGFIEEVEKLNQSLIRFLADGGIDGIILGDDIAYAQGLMMRPSVFREYFFPSLSRQVAAAKKKDLPVFYHSDGNYRDVIPDIIDIGFSGLHCIDRSSGMDIMQVQQEVGNALCLWGHLDATCATQAGDAEKLPVLVDSIRRLAAGKRFILGTNSGLFQGMDCEGLRTLYRSVSPIASH